METPQKRTTNELEIGSLRVLGVVIEDVLAIMEFKVAYILGKHFKAGEWGNYRCGSVVTCVIDRQSYYARVERFFRVDGDSCPGYASVRWFGQPHYPLGTPMVVRCSEEEPQELVDSFGCILRITQIDPSQVIVERDDTGYSWMMRDSGFDMIS